MNNGDGFMSSTNRVGELVKSVRLSELVKENEKKKARAVAKDRNESKLRALLGRLVVAKLLPKDVGDLTVEHLKKATHASFVHTSLVLGREGAFYAFRAHLFISEGPRNRGQTEQKPPGTRARGHATSTRKAPLNPPPKSSGPKLAVATFGGAFRAI